MKFSPVDVARQFLFVREAGPNTGQRVEAIQKWCGGSPGDSWCCEFATMVLDICFQGESPIPRGAVVQDVLDFAGDRGWLTYKPEPGDLFLYTNNAHAHHIGFVTGVNPMVGIAGNTSEDGTSSNGTGVYEHAIRTPLFIKYPR